MLKDKTYKFDLFVIGGGSGGLSAAKEAASLGATVGLADFIKPTPKGTTWGLGGTCVNVGCIPKKMMHHAGNLYENLNDYTLVGRTEPITKQHDWNKMVDNVQTYIFNINTQYFFSLITKQVQYFNKLARLIDNHTIELTDSSGKVETVTADKILIAVGGRPSYAEDKIEGSKEHCITSDDLFSLSKPPGKTLVVGASYIALECGGFLNALGYDTSIMVRSILLRGFDQVMANKLGDYMKNHGMKFINTSTPTKVYKSNGGQHNLTVEYKDTKTNETFTIDCDTCLLAIGRYSDTIKLGCENAGVKVNENGKVIVDEYEKSNIDNIYSIGDCAEGRPELTPPAIMAGKLLAQRLYGGSNTKMDYTNIATAVFTPLEYGCCGYSDDEARKKFGSENIVVYHSVFKPVEWMFDLERVDECYAKVVVNKADGDKIIGFHILSPNAGEIVQGMAVALKCGITKDILDSSVGIHPTIAEEFTLLTITTEQGNGQKTSC